MQMSQTRQACFETRADLFRRPDKPFVTHFRSRCFLSEDAQGAAPKAGALLSGCGVVPQ